MKFSGKMCLMIILKVTKNQGLTLSLEDTFIEKRQGGQIEIPSRFTVNNKTYQQEANLFSIETFLKVPKRIQTIPRGQYKQTSVVRVNTIVAGFDVGTKRVEVR